MATNDGGPAFPVPMVPCDNQGGFTDVREQGLSLRDWFAGQALAGILASDRSWTLGEVTGFAYRYADLMLEERSKCTT